MRVSFDGRTFDPDKEEQALRDAIEAKTERMIQRLEDDQLRPALHALFAGSTLIAVKLGAMAALHHAYSASADYKLVDTFAHVLNKLVGLNYVPPEQIVHTAQETDSGITQEG